MTDDNKMGLESLDVWQKSMQFAVDVCRDLLRQFPVEEKFSLSQQMRRAVQSIPLNIAEGYGRFYYQEGIRFCYIARGSVEEVYSQLQLAYKLGYINEQIYNHYNVQIKEIRKQINGYISYLRRSKRGEKDQVVIIIFAKTLHGWMTNNNFIFKMKTSLKITIRRISDLITDYQLQSNRV